MQMAQIVGGYSLGGADLLRRAMGKKNAGRDGQAARRSSAKAPRRTASAPRKADAIFDLMEKFAGYGFNKSHAAAYALVAYQTAWLKVHYPAEFMAAVLSSDMDNTDKVVTFLDESRAIGLIVLPPDVNASRLHVRGARANATHAADPLRPRRDQGRRSRRCRSHRRGARARRSVHTTSPTSASASIRSKLNKRVLEALDPVRRTGCAGDEPREPDGAAARGDEGRRAAGARRAGRPERHVRRDGQPDVGRESSLTPLRVQSSPNGRSSSSLAGERETLGHYLSGHPTDAWRELIAQLANCPIGEIAKHYKPPAARTAPRAASASSRSSSPAWSRAMRKRGDSRWRSCSSRTGSGKHRSEPLPRGLHRIRRRCSRATRSSSSKAGCRSTSFPADSSCARARLDAQRSLRAPGARAAR